METKADQIGWKGLPSAFRGGCGIAEVGKRELGGHQQTHPCDLFEVSLDGDASAVWAYLGNINSKPILLSFSFSEEEAKGSFTFQDCLY